MKEIIIRQERPDEFRAVEELVRDAFWDVYRPGCDEHYLTYLLRSSEVLIPGLSVAAEVAGQIAGVIYYARAEIAAGEPEIGRASCRERV